MKLVIRGHGIVGRGNLRLWQPENPDVVAEYLYVDIGSKPGKGADTFSILVATPAGLDTLEEREGILASRALLVMKRYNFEDLWRWLERTVSKCEAETWNACVEKLRIYFQWEYENYKEG
ncbi:Imm8 family immunity protein [Pendulispora albinea]|uniref:Immunity 8 family protein n=1 Tax=Pendulispora albinea TaxID=2741071 RepID=A0ABZ2MAI8_9BACT